MSFSEDSELDDCEYSLTLSTERSRVIRRELLFRELDELAMANDRNNGSPYAVTQEEVYLYSDDEIEVVPFTKKAPIIVTLDGDKELVSEFDADTLNIQMNAVASETRAIRRDITQSMTIISREVGARDSLSELQLWYSTLVDIKAKLEDFKITLRLRKEKN